ncbi:hypothetical protein D3C74_412350 [compost metagenome]
MQHFYRYHTFGILLANKFGTNSLSFVAMILMVEARDSDTFSFFLMTAQSLQQNDMMGS